MSIDTDRRRRRACARRARGKGWCGRRSRRRPGCRRCRRRCAAWSARLPNAVRVPSGLNSWLVPPARVASAGPSPTAVTPVARTTHSLLPSIAPAERHEPPALRRHLRPQNRHTRSASRTKNRFHLTRKLRATEATLTRDNRRQGKDIRTIDSWSSTRLAQPVIPVCLVTMYRWVRLE